MTAATSTPAPRLARSFETAGSTSGPWPRRPSRPLARTALTPIRWIGIGAWVAALVIGHAVYALALAAASAVSRRGRRSDGATPDQGATPAR